MYISFAFVCGKIYTVFAYGEDNILTAGLSAYGGLIGVVIAIVVVALFSSKGNVELEEVNYPLTLVGEAGLHQITYNELVAKTNYLRANNLPVIVNGKPNTIYGMSNKNMQKKFGI